MSACCATSSSLRVSRLAATPQRAWQKRPRGRLASNGSLLPHGFKAWLVGSSPDGDARCRQRSKSALR